MPDYGQFGQSVGWVQPVVVAGGALDAPAQPSYARINGGYWRQVISLSGPTSGQIRLTYRSQQTGDLAYNATASAVQTALLALSSVGAGNATVQGNNLTQDRQVVTFAPSLTDPYTFITQQSGTTPPAPAATFTCGALVKDAAGVLGSITVNNHSGGGTIEVYDAPQAGDARNLLARVVVPTGAAPATYTFGARFNVGLVVVCPSTMDLTVVYQ